MSDRPLHGRVVRRSTASRRRVLAALVAIFALVGTGGAAPAGGQGGASGQVVVESPGSGQRLDGGQATSIVIRVTSSPEKVTAADLDITLLSPSGTTITPKFSAGPAVPYSGGGWQEDFAASPDLSDNLGTYTMNAVLKVKGATIASASSTFVVGVPASLAEAVIVRANRGARGTASLDPSQFVRFTDLETEIAAIAGTFADPSTGMPYSVYDGYGVNVLRQALGVPTWPGPGSSFPAQVADINKVLAALSWRAVAANDDQKPAGAVLVKYATQSSGDSGSCNDTTNATLLSKASSLFTQAQDSQAVVVGASGYNAAWYTEDYFGTEALGDYHGVRDPTIEVDISRGLDVVPLVQVELDNTVAPIDRASLVVADWTALGLHSAVSSNPPPNMSATFEVEPVLANWVASADDWDLKSSGTPLGSVTFTARGSKGTLAVPAKVLGPIGGTAPAALVLNVAPQEPPPAFPPKRADLVVCGSWSEVIGYPVETLVYHQTFPTTVPVHIGTVSLSVTDRLNHHALMLRADVVRLSQEKQVNEDDIAAQTAALTTAEAALAATQARFGPLTSKLSEAKSFLAQIQQAEKGLSSPVQTELQARRIAHRFDRRPPGPRGCCATGRADGHGQELGRPYFTPPGAALGGTKGPGRARRERRCPPAQVDRPRRVLAGPALFLAPGRGPGRVRRGPGERRPVLLPGPTCPPRCPALGHRPRVGQHRLLHQGDIRLGRGPVLPGQRARSLFAAGRAGQSHFRSRNARQPAGRGAPCGQAGLGQRRKPSQRLPGGPVQSDLVQRQEEVCHRPRLQHLGHRLGHGQGRSCGRRC